ncbi:ParA family protein [Candidatus Bathyarchaeota archaeon]|nr:MAG: ParA family protein [Candidatus Bathyarchaeota archaeon]
MEIVSGLPFSETICDLHENVYLADAIPRFLHRYIQGLTPDGVITPLLSNNVLDHFALPVIYCQTQNSESLESPIIFLTTRTLPMIACATRSANEFHTKPSGYEQFPTMILSFANNKGGTGKTTTAVNLATALAQLGRKVLLVDLDPQGSTTVSLGFQKSKLLYTVYDALAQSKRIASNLDLAGAEVELSSIPGREFVLREALAVARHKYDAILIDCPPNIGILTVNAIVACDLMIVPVQSEFLSMDGLPTLLKFMRIVKSRAKTDFDYRILLTLFDKRTGLSKKVVQQLRTSFGDHILKIVIPRSIRMAEAPSKGIPGIIYSPRNSASEEYRRLTKELLEGSLADTVLTKLGSTAD